jgi:myb proto-oncogene protein
LEEEKKMFELQKKLGNKWAEIASNMKGRTDNNVKNYFYSTLRKSLRKLNTFISLNRMELKAAK